MAIPTAQSKSVNENAWVTENSNWKIAGNALIILAIVALAAVAIVFIVATHGAALPIVALVLDAVGGGLIIRKAVKNIFHQINLQRNGCVELLRKEIAESNDSKDYNADGEYVMNALSTAAIKDYFDLKVAKRDPDGKLLHFIMGGDRKALEDYAEQAGIGSDMISSLVNHMKKHGNKTISKKSTDNEILTHIQNFGITNILSLGVSRKRVSSILSNKITDNNNPVLQDVCIHIIFTHLQGNDPLIGDFREAILSINYTPKKVASVCQRLNFSAAQTKIVMDKVFPE